MKFYVSWYPGDPWYPDFYPDCNMLISVTSVSQSWKLSKHKSLPASLIIDSGGFRFATNPEERMTPKQVFMKQLKLIDHLPKEVFLCSLDYPILDISSSEEEKDRFISKTIGYAYEFFELVKNYKGIIPFRPIVIIQGYDIHSLRFCARELLAIGFHRFGLGSMIRIRDEDELVQRVKAVTDEVGYDLHIFGISSMQMIKRIKQIGDLSVDSARPAKSAMYNQILFWERDKMLRIWENRERGLIQIPHEQDQRPNPVCICPVCCGTINPEIMKTGARKHIYLRTLHNYWHINQAIMDL